ncbi:MAG TPA: thiamine pyrophosphate-binding protein [Candidatus Acetatifactor stercoripullorum]|uniref:Thiamine pyrophosphate-binding protein n=1 Tax=Candidatus Acetatifactor stercoripullorum TaxID=2838414 RepID=A0A9D1R5C8_9FIRM|nr:thiamine pyrophosphate-binding protein [uncultured Acetatifactor sp.]HIW80366.1 thiamine pyrophosphate-binding protein [Candidatus Acetatifactor stercoripullorum]
MKKRVADIIMDTLMEYGIDTCFAVVGGGAMHLDNALLVCERMKKYFHHHEQACAMAAEAYARYSGRMAAVCVTSGPGATNTLTGVMGAWQDSLPMIVLSGQVRYEISVPKSGLDLRYRGIQEFEIVPTVKNMTKYAVMVIDPLAVKRELVKAIHLALDGRKGPVWLDIPQDVQNARVEEEDLYPLEQFISEIPVPAQTEVKDVLGILQNAERPCILAGSGIISGNVRNEFEEFVEQMGVPVIGGAWVADNFYLEHPLYFGPSGNVGPRTGNFILQNADVILTLGNSLGFRQTGFNQEGFAPKAKIYMVDVDAEEGKKPGLRIERFIHSDLKQFFDISRELGVAKKEHKSWLEYCNRLKHRFNPYEATEHLKTEDRVCSYQFWKIFAQYEPADSILALGNNTANTAKLQLGVAKKEQRVLTNYTCGSMGYDIPAAIGAAVSSGKQVFCVTGDGSIMMNLQELQTIVQYDLPIHIVVFNNDGYGAIRQTSKNFFQGKYIGCTPDSGVSFPDFQKVADTFGFAYLCCKTNAELEETVRQMLNAKQRVLLEVMQAFDDPVTPKVMSRLDENGKMLTPALHDMYPFLDEKEMEQLMLWK